MNQELFSSVDGYLVQKLLAPDPALAEALRANAAAGLPAIDVTPNQGKFLYLLAKLQRARQIMEVGTLGGYSTIWLARALPPEGRLITLELEAKHAEVARQNLVRAGVAARVQIKVGRAADSLAALQQERSGPFDFVFIDADKPSTLDYFRSALELCRPGALIVVDNVIRKGEIADAKSTDASVLGMRRFLEGLASEGRVEATGLQTVGAKGYDGFVVARVRD